MRHSYRFGDRSVNLNITKLTPRVHVVLPRVVPPQSQAQVEARKDFPDGTVIILRGRTTRAVPQKYTSIYSAIRSKVLLGVRYGLRKSDGELQETQRMVGEARKNLDSLVSPKKFEDFEKYQVHMRLVELASGLEAKQNLWKQAAYDFIDVASDRTDMLGRNNPGAKAVQVRHGMENLELRLMEIPQIASFMSRDEEALLIAQMRHLDLCRRVYKSLQRALGGSILKKPQVYQDTEAPSFSGWINNRVAQIHMMEVSPYTRTRFYLLKDLSDAGRAGKKGDWITVAQILIRMENSLKLRLIQPRLEETLLKVSTMIEIIKKDPEWGLEFANSRRHALGNFLLNYRYYIQQSVDESGFRRPVLKSFLKNLEKAAHRLSWSERDPKGVRVRQELNFAKRNLKFALKVL